MGLPYRPLGLVKELLEQIGFEVSYAYDDLVFMEHNHFLLQFGKVGEILFFYASIDTADANAQLYFTKIQTVARTQGITLLQRGRYRLEAGENENLSLELFEGASSSLENE